MYLFYLPELPGSGHHHLPWPWSQPPHKFPGCWIFLRFCAFSSLYFSTLEKVLSLWKVFIRRLSQSWWNIIWMKKTLFEHFSRRSYKIFRHLCPELIICCLAPATNLPFWLKTEQALTQYIFSFFGNLINFSNWV